MPSNSYPNDAAKPKAARSAYIFFAGATIKRLMEESKEEMKVTEAAKEAGQLWGKMTDEEKMPYVK